VPDLHIVVLAAGKGTRMKSERPKVLHRVAGRPMIEHVLDTAGALKPQSTTVVIGHRADELRKALNGRAGLNFAVQDPQLGTAHALLTAATHLKDASGSVVLLSGDVPLLTAATLEALVSQHVRTDADATLLTARVDNPTGYGRIVRNGDQVTRIVEERDADAAERGIGEINAGIYAFRIRGDAGGNLFEALRSIAPDNAQKEYYLPDLIGIYREQGRNIQAVTLSSGLREIQGINSRSELAEVSRAIWRAKNHELMAAGVTIEDPDTTYIDGSVTIGADTTIHPGVTLQGSTSIGTGCEIFGGVRVADSAIGDRVTVLDHCVLTQVTIADDVSIGPFAHLRNGATLNQRAKVGNFVEIKKSVVGAGSKAMHLAYLGDAVIGKSVNIGAGTITCNYDGVQKHQTTIADGAFIGSDTQLIAPVTVGEGAYVGTGTTVREEVPAGALAVSAGKQRNIPGWVAERKKKRS
jgi:bifunctional UDP-N-acetylglucosamine pyrophosphorylase/glucosamine-1-phosphate N-acetyltransferase